MEIHDLLKITYGNNDIPLKTVSTALWSLTIAGKLKRYDPVELKEPLFGLPEWFDDYELKPDYLKKVNSDTDFTTEEAMEEKGTDIGHRN